MKVESYKPLPKQKEFHQSPHRYRYFNGAFGAGKTLALIQEAIDLSLSEPYNFGLICRKYQEDLRDTVIQTFIESCPAEVYQSKEGGKRVEFTNGSVLVFSGLYTRSKVRISKVMSYNLGFAGIDQAEEVSEEDFLMVGRRLRKNNIKNRCMFLAANPPPEDHWLYQYFVEGVDGQGNKIDKENYFLVNSSSYENKYLPADYIKSLEAMPENWRRRFLYGEFGFLLYGFPVYKSFDEPRHIKEIEPDKGLVIYRGWDFGWVHPSVSYLQINNDGQVRILKELMGDKTYLEDFAPRAVRFTNEHFHGFNIQDYCDTAGKQRTDSSKKTSIDILKLNDIYPKHKNLDILKSIEIIEQKMCEFKNGQESFLIHPDCKHLISGYAGGYHYPKKADGNVESKPHKDGFYVHLQDATRYIIGNIFKGVDGIRTGGSSVNIKIAVPSWGC